MYKYYIVIGLVALLITADVTKAERKPKKVHKSGGEQKSVFHKGLVKSFVRPKTILEHHHNFSIRKVSEKRFSGEVLGYITPWNTDGLVNALQFAGKFSSYSPVWFRILRGQTEITGLNDINKEWLDDIRSNAIANSTVKILPRVLFESWTGDTVNELYRDIKKRDKLIRSLTDLAQKHQFEGYVIELWNQFLATEVDKKIIIGIIREISAGLKKKYLKTILVIPPWRGFSGEEIFSKSDFNSLVKYVNSFSLMSYDYSSVQKPGPNAPLYWIKRCVEYLIPDEFDPKRRKILIGLNFYGYIYTSEGGAAVIGRDYIKYIKKHEGEIKWDDTNQEHWMDFKSIDPNNLPSGMLFYPTLYSLKQRMDLAEVLHTGIAIWEIGQGLNYFFDLL